MSKWSRLCVSCCILLVCVSFQINTYGDLDEHHFFHGRLFDAKKHAEQATGASKNPSVVEKTCLVGGFKHFFNFHPYLGK